MKRILDFIEIEPTEAFREEVRAAGGAAAQLHQPPPALALGSSASTPSASELTSGSSTTLSGSRARPADRAVPSENLESRLKVRTT